MSPENLLKTPLQIKLRFNPRGDPFQTGTTNHG